MDTICAISTPPGIGGIAVARVSGDRAIEITDRIWCGKSLASACSHTAHLGSVRNNDGDILDEAVATVFRAPKSYTGEDVVEISVHGSKYVQQQMIHTLIAQGARLAQPGEFTRRAFIAGRFDLAQAEAVADIIASENRASHRIAIKQMRGGFSERLRLLRDKLIDLASLIELELDFSEEDVEFASREQILATAQAVRSEVNRLSASFNTGTAIKEGIPVAIVGVTNAGKSSLLNALVGEDRAIVSDIHGTTRDIVEDFLTIGDYKFRIMDTAGMRDTEDTIERLGIDRSNRAVTHAEIIILVIDSTNPQIPELPQTDAPIIAIYNKTDIAEKDIMPIKLPQAPHSTINISAHTGQGIDELKHTLQAITAECETSADGILVSNARHYEALTRAGESITRAINGITNGLTGDLIALDIRETIHYLGEILGEISSDTILHTIFSRFCIGK